MTTSDETAQGAQLGADRPKETLVDDLLGYASFSRAIARTIASLTITDGIVLAINGDWGSGKTTAANMLVDALSQMEETKPEAKKTIIVRFNPWWFSGQEDLVRAFFGEVSSVLEKSVSEKVITALKSVGRRAAGAKDLVVGVADLLPGGGLVKGAAGGALQLLGRFSEDEGSLSSRRGKLCEALREDGRRILVITDDIDRLPADEIRQIFRLVKSVADLPNVIHLLLFEREIARRALGEDQEHDGPSWLEKIVQAPFNLPPVQSVDLHRMLFQGLNQLADGSPDHDATRWGNTFYDAVAPWLHTPRDVGRLLNAVRVSLPPIQQEVDFSDFIGLETLRVFEPKLHAFIRNNPNLLTGVQSSHEKADSAFGDRLLSYVPELRRDKSRQALMRLFPRLEAVWQRNSYSSGFLSTWDAQRRACSERHFPAYFGFAVGNDALPRAELSGFAETLNDPKATRAKVAEYATVIRPSGGTRAAVLLTELTSSLADLPAASSSEGDAVVSILGAADLFCTPPDERGQGFLDIPALWKVWWVVDPLLKRMPLELRVDTITRAIETSPKFTGLNFMMVVLSDRLGREPESKPETEREPLVDADTLDRLETLYLSRIRAAAESGDLLDESSLIETLLRWEKLAGDAEVKAWTGKAILDDTAALKLAKAATQVGRSHAAGDRVVREIPQVSRQALAKVLDVDELTLRVQVAANLADPAAFAIASRFQAGLDRKPW